MSRPSLAPELHQRPWQRAYVDRKKQGLVRSSVPWSWVTSAQAAEAARQAFRTASWVAHRDNLQPVAFAGLLATHTGLLLHQIAREQGVLPALPPGCPDPAAELLHEVTAANWRPQYPVYQEASKDLA